MKCPECGNETKKGEVFISGNITSLMGPVVTWTPENEKRKLFSRNDIILSNANVKGYYCDTCMKVFAVFDEE